MNVAFDGMENLVVTFQAETVTAGKFAAMHSNRTVQDAADGTAPVGLTLHRRGSHAAVQTRGYVQCSYSGGTAPELGWNQLVADGTGGLRPAAESETGRACLVVQVDSESKRMGLFL